MATGRGSVLTNLLADNRRINGARKMLGLTERGIKKAEPARIPPAVAPADNRPPATAPQPPAGEGAAAPPNEFRASMEAKAEQLLSGLRTGATPPPSEAQVDVVRAGATGLQPALVAASAVNEPVETQFYRLMGRPGSPRELSILETRLNLERELGRPPTIPELRSRIVEPGPATASAMPVAFEIPSQ